MATEAKLYFLRCERLAFGSRIPADALPACCTVRCSTRPFSCSSLACWRAKVIKLDQLGCTKREYPFWADAQMILKAAAVHWQIIR